MNKSNKSKTVTLILCVLLGYLGIHRFYAGKIKSGILYLCTAGLCGIGWIVDIVLIVTDRFFAPAAISSAATVYTTENSNIYHYNPHCYGMLSTISMNLNDARRIGLHPCSRCCPK